MIKTQMMALQENLPSHPQSIANSVVEGLSTSIKILTATCMTSFVQVEEVSPSSHVSTTSLPKESAPGKQSQNEMFSLRR
ncbi:hypothetical protein sscle_08g062900 [Sclerotinia sclerotiorum 1980 UF-70]|uniref:Uncharacterized protein n=1 Tax=Sclerotinia sclerotiorum (strain ATCC 18683 / 1980 / Ss-1) TaxID=665079 RepID=A0A1D9Q997_SCLS1|nr:hypothetical protein sscle_08g062900 [Sclerotinia sclerotiorum 1980 UF-70]